MATIAVSGSSGLIGSALVTLLRDEGHDVLRLLRQAAVELDEVGWLDLYQVMKNDLAYGFDIAGFLTTMFL